MPGGWTEEENLDPYAQIQQQQEPGEHINEETLQTELDLDALTLHFHLAASSKQTRERSLDRQLLRRGDFLMTESEKQVINRKI